MYAASLSFHIKWLHIQERVCGIGWKRLYMYTIYGRTC